LKSYFCEETALAENRGFAAIAVRRYASLAMLMSIGVSELTPFFGLQK